MSSKRVATDQRRGRYSVRSVRGTGDIRDRTYSRKRRVWDSEDSEYSTVDEETQSRTSESDREYLEPLELSEGLK